MEPSLPPRTTSHTVLIALLTSLPRNALVVLSQSYVSTSFTVCLAKNCDLDSRKKKIVVVDIFNPPAQFHLHCLFFFVSSPSLHHSAGGSGSRFISFEDRNWHNDCFLCSGCSTSLIGKGFIPDGPDILCSECARQRLA